MGHGAGCRGSCCGWHMQEEGGGTVGKLEQERCLMFCSLSD